MKVREIVRMLQDDGWYQVRMKGAIFKQAGLNK